MPKQQDLNQQTNGILGRKNKEGEEMQNYQAASSQLLRIQAAQKENLALARAAGNQDLAQAQLAQQAVGVAMQANQQNSAQTQNMSVNPQTQAILTKYGLGQPKMQKSQSHQQQITKQNIVINNNTTNTTTNNVNANGNGAYGGPVQGRALAFKQPDNNGKFKTWLNNLFAKQSEEAAKRDRMYEKKESSLTRSANKMVKKMEEFGKSIGERLDPKRMGTTLMGQLKTLLFVFGIQYLAQNWDSIMNTVESIEKSVTRFVHYFTEPKSDKGNRTGFQNSLISILGGDSNDKNATVFDSFKNLFMGDGKGHEGFFGLIKGYFSDQAKEKLDAAKTVKLPKIDLNKPIESLPNLVNYLGDLLKALIGGSEAAKQAVTNSYLSSGDYSISKKANEMDRLNQLAQRQGSIYERVTEGGHKFNAMASSLFRHNGESSTQRYGMSNYDFDIKDKSKLNEFNGANATESQAQFLANQINQAQNGHMNAGEVMSSFRRMNNYVKDHGKYPLALDTLTSLARNLGTKDFNQVLNALGPSAQLATYNYVVRKKSKDDESRENSGMMDEAIKSYLNTSVRDKVAGNFSFGTTGLNLSRIGNDFNWVEDYDDINNGTSEEGVSARKVVEAIENTLPTAGNVAQHTLASAAGLFNDGLANAINTAGDAVGAGFHKHMMLDKKEILIPKSQIQPGDYNTGRTETVVELDKDAMNKLFGIILNKKNKNGNGFDSAEFNGNELGSLEEFTNGIRAYNKKVAWDKKSDGEQLGNATKTLKELEIKKKERERVRQERWDNSFVKKAGNNIVKEAGEIADSFVGAYDDAREGYNHGQQHKSIAMPHQTSATAEKDPHTFGELSSDLFGSGSFGNMSSQLFTVSDQTAQSAISSVNLEKIKAANNNLRSGKERVKFALQLIKERLGLTDAQASGIVGVLYAESRLDPRAFNNEEKTGSGRSKGIKYLPLDYGAGIAQWTFRERKNAILNYLRQRTGQNYVRIEDFGLSDQLEAVCWEIKNRSNLYSKLKSATTPQEAADLVLRGYENGNKNSLASKESMNAYKWAGGYNGLMATRGAYASEAVKVANGESTGASFGTLAANKNVENTGNEGYTESKNLSDYQKSEEEKENENKPKSLFARIFDKVKNIGEGIVEFITSKKKSVDNAIAGHSKIDAPDSLGNRLDGVYSSVTYDGPIYSEFVNYSDYNKHPGKIKPGLSFAEWRNEVRRMTGSNPVDLILDRNAEAKRDKNDDLLKISDIPSSTVTSNNISFASSKPTNTITSTSTKPVSEAIGGTGDSYGFKIHPEDLSDERSVEEDYVPGFHWIDKDDNLFYLDDEFEDAYKLFGNNKPDPNRKTWAEDPRVVKAYLDWVKTHHPEEIKKEEKLSDEYGFKIHPEDLSNERSVEEDYVPGFHWIDKDDNLFYIDSEFEEAYKELNGDLPTPKRFSWAEDPRMVKAYLDWKEQNHPEDNKFDAVNNYKIHPEDLSNERSVEEDYVPGFHWIDKDDNLFYIDSEFEDAYKELKGEMPTPGRFTWAEDPRMVNAYMDWVKQNHPNKDLKTADEIGGDVQQVMDKYTSNIHWIDKDAGLGWTDEKFEEAYNRGERGDNTFKDERVNAAFRDWIKTHHPDGAKSKGDKLEGELSEFKANIDKMFGIGGETAEKSITVEEKQMSYQESSYEMLRIIAERLGGGNEIAKANAKLLAVVGDRVSQGSNQISKAASKPQQKERKIHSPVNTKTNGNTN